MTLSIAATYIFWFLIGLVVSQGFLVVGFIVALLRFRRPLSEDDKCPKAAVILCLRGTDPYLDDCFQAILDQDYPTYVLHVVVDSSQDPAWDLANKYVNTNYSAESPRPVVKVVPLTERLDTCSLKCSSVVQVVKSLDESYAFIAQLDADTIPHRTWLRELATALNDDRVGAATGNRWYMPTETSTGSLIRWLWNAAAVVQMYWYQIAWGGTLAVKLSAIRKAELIHHWSHAFCEDTMLFAKLKPHRLQVRFVPSLMMINRELCDVPGFFSWVRRQLLTARLYHPGWPAVVGHGVLTTLFLFVPILFGIWALIQRDTVAAIWSFGGLVAYQAAMFPLVGGMEIAVRRIARFRGQPTNWLSWWILLQMPVTLFATQIVYARAMLSANFLRRVNWRGIWYDIPSPWGVRMTKYEPYMPTSAEIEQRHSL